MNNKVVLKIVAICAAIFVVFSILTAVFAARLTPGDWFNNGDLVIGRGEPFTYHKEEFADLDGITQLNIETVSSNVTFYESDSQLEVILDCEGYTNTESVTLQFEQTGSTITAAVKYPTTFWGNLSLTKSSLMVGIPSSYSERVYVNGVSSEVYLDNIGDNEFSEVKVHTVSGDVFIKCKGIDKLELDSVSGEVNVRQTMINSLDVDTTSGDIEINSLSEDCTEVYAHSVSGKISLVYDSLCKSKIDTTSGDVILDIPEGSKIDLDFDSTSGDIRGDYNKSSDGVFVQVDTTSGDLIIE